MAICDVDIIINFSFHAINQLIYIQNYKNLHEYLRESYKNLQESRLPGAAVDFVERGGVGAGSGVADGVKGEGAGHEDVVVIASFCAI